MEKTRKIVIYGLSRTGKTTFLKTILTEGKQINHINPTILIDIKRKKIGDFNVLIWDCGGQEQFLKVYHKDSVSKEIIYRAEDLIYFFDVNDKKRFNQAITEFKWIAKIFKETNQNGKIHCFINKADLVGFNQKKLNSFKEEIENNVKIKNIQYYYTSKFKPNKLIEIFTKIIHS